jgi:hypothetical protein
MALRPMSPRAVRGQGPNRAEICPQPRPIRCAAFADRDKRSRFTTASAGAQDRRRFPLPRLFRRSQSNRPAAIANRFPPSGTRNSVGAWSDASLSEFFTTNFASAGAAWAPSDLLVFVGKDTLKTSGSFDISHPTLASTVVIADVPVRSGRQRWVENLYTFAVSRSAKGRIFRKINCIYARHSDCTSTGIRLAGPLVAGLAEQLTPFSLLLRRYP